MKESTVSILSLCQDTELSPTVPYVEHGHTSSTLGATAETSPDPVVAFISDPT
jgi:hypothetical protein